MVKPENYFYFADGRIVKSIKEFAMKLDEISSESFFAHVNEHKNDFADWIENIFKSKELAKKLRKVFDKREFQIILLKHLLAQKTKRIKKFKCDLCNKTFSTKVGLSVHYTIAHKRGDQNE